MCGCRFAVPARRRDMGRQRLRLFRLATADNAKAGVAPTGRPLCAEGKDKAKAGVVNQSPRHPERGMPATASSRRRGQLDVEGHAWRRHEAPAGRGGRRARARVSERERTHDAHDNKLVAETGDRSFSSVAEGAPRSVVGSRQEIAQQATTTHAKTRRVGFAG